MHSGRFVFSQLMEHLPAKVFRRCVQRYRGDRRIQSFTVSVRSSRDGSPIADAHWLGQLFRQARSFID